MADLKTFLSQTALCGAAAAVIVSCMAGPVPTAATPVKEVAAPKAPIQPETAPLSTPSRYEREKARIRAALEKFKNLLETGKDRGPALEAIGAPPGEPYCTYFVSVVAGPELIPHRRNGQPVSSTAQLRGMMKDIVVSYRDHPAILPEEGDILLWRWKNRRDLTRGHSGFVEGVEGNRIDYTSANAYDHKTHRHGILEESGEFGRGLDKYWRYYVGFIPLREMVRKAEEREATKESGYSVEGVPPAVPAKIRD